MMESFSSYSRRFLAALMASACIFLGGIAVAHAETHITNGYLDQDTVWDASNSPYLIEDPVTVPEGISLTVNPGVKIIGTDLIDGYNLVDIEGGTLVANGSSGSHISFNGFGGIVTERGGTTTLAYADISNADGMSLFDSHLTAASSSITNTSQALYIASSFVSITNTNISNNQKGIFVESSTPSGIRPAFGTLGDLSIGSADLGSSSVRIVDSEITQNSGAAIENQDAVPVIASHVWWGSNEGPTFSGSNSLIGSVEYEPWQEHASTSICCSDVLFIPGIEASRVYTSSHSLLGTTTIRGWEPLSNASAKTLYMDPDGTSISQTYSGDPIDKAYGISEVYGTFMKFMNNLVSGGTIGQWKAFGYDWRKSIPEVVAGPEKKATTTESLIDTVMSMASSSKTGKVTLVAHSNGGLVAKYLIKTLTDMGKADLIDKVISVAVPYLGTPLAIPSLLYGDGMSFGYGLLLKQSVAQKLGENMASAYSLLPSATYFSQVVGPTIAYASGSSTPITSASAQDSFIASKLNNILMAAAESLHAIIDPFQWPSAIQRWALVGYGNDTIKSMTYSKVGSDKHTDDTTLMGDSTVIAESAAYNAGTTTALDLPTISKTESKSFNHQNILSASSTDQAITDIIENKTNSLNQIPGVSMGLPLDENAGSRIVVSTHSPVDLHVYDSQGNHAGIIPAPAESGVTDDIVSFYETNIPGSSFEQNGGDGTGDDTDTEISLPAGSGQKYSVSIQGNGVGEFTYEVQRFNGNMLQSDTVYSGLPTTPLTIASTTIDSNADASSSAPLTIDIDGDGITDVIANPGSALDPISFFGALKRSIVSLLGSNDRRADNFSNRIDKVETLFEKNKTKKVTNKLLKLEVVLGHKKYKSLSQNDRDAIADMIDGFLKTFEN